MIMFLLTMLMHMIILESMKKITDKELFDEIFADLDLEAAHDLLTEEEVDDLFEREKARSRVSQGHSRYDEDGDISAMMELTIS